MNVKYVIPLLFALTALLVSCSEQTSNVAAHPEVEKKEHLQPVKIISLDQSEVTNNLEYTSTLSASEEVYFAPASPGRIDKIFVEIGDRVSKGEQIALMDQTQLVQARIQLKQLEVDFKRMEQLRSTNTISEQQYDQVKVQYDVAKANIAFLEENTSLIAPFSGIVTGKYFEDGEMYSGAPNTPAGKAALVSLMQIRPMEAIISVSEKFFSEVHEDMEATLRTDVYPADTFRGQIHRIHPTINSATRTFNVELRVNNNDELLRPGMYSKVYLNLGDYSAFMVPALAVLQQQGTADRFVFIHKDGVAHKVYVKIGKRFDDQLEIIADEITKGTQIVVSGQRNLMDQQEVKVIQ